MSAITRIAASNSARVSSGSVANLTGLTVARDTMCPDVLMRGVRADAGPLTLCASDQVHNSVDKMAGVLGIGCDQLRRVPARADFTCDVPTLASAIAADLAARERLWLHVDAAFGAAMAASKTHRHRLAGIERADSVAFDLHKWFYMPYDIGCTLIRHPGAERHSFSPPGAYLEPMTGGIAANSHSFGELGLDLSRGFRALKAWMSLQEHGIDGYGAMIDKNIAQARYLADSIEASDDLELLAPVPTNVVCFRHRGRRLTANGNDAPPDALDSLNKKILIALHERGIAAPSHTRIRGVFAIRLAITNHRSRRSDFDVLLDAVRSIAAEQSDR